MCPPPRFRLAPKLALGCTTESPCSGPGQSKDTVRARVGDGVRVRMSGELELGLGWGED